MVNLGINMSSFTAGLSNASSQLNSFANSTAKSFQNVNRAAGTAGNGLNTFSKGASSGLKNVSRVVQGILISQAFYRIARAAEEAGSAVVKFGMDCEDAKVSFSLLMKDGDKAGRFMTYLQDFAAKTPYTMQQAVTNARKLLAYGFSADNMNPLLTTIADASSASGDKETFDRVARALGQIHTKGKLAQQELLQLTEAGIPAFEILRDKLKLTSDQLGAIAKQKIPADVAINAILKGMQERYGGASQAISNTMRGMLSTIKDNALIIGSTAFNPLYQGVERVVKKFRDLSDTMRETVRNSGMGGLMRSIIPAEMLPQIQLFIANIKGISQAVGRLLAAFGPIISQMLQFALTVANMVLPFVQILIQIISYLAQAFSQCSPAVRAFVTALGGIFVVAGCIQLLLNFRAVLMGLFIVKTIAQLVVGLAKAISILSMAIVRNPWIAAIGLAVGGLAMLAYNSKTVKNALGGVGDKINSAFGNDPSKVFTPKMKENTKVDNEFNKHLDISKDKLDDMGDSAKKAGQKAKDSLMSFDEVFNLKDQDEAGTGLDAGALNDIGDVGAPEIPPISVPDAEYPDPGAGIQSFFDDFVNQFKDKMKNTLIGAGLGALLGALIGGLLFGPEGAKWGAILGAGIGGIIGYFWDQLSDKAKWTIGGAGVGAAIGAIIGGLIGGPLGAAIGAILGAGIGALIGNWWAGLTSSERWGAGIGGGAGAIIGAIIGGLIGGPIGAVIGGLLGGTIGMLIGKWWADLTDTQKWSVGIGGGAGAVIGGIIGFLIAGPMGAAIGALLGAGIGGLIGDWWAGLTDQQKWANGGSAAGGTIGGIIGFLIAGPIGAVIGLSLGTVIGGLVGNWWSEMTDQQKWTAGVGAGAGAIIGGIIGTLICPGLGTAVGALLGGGLGAWIGKYWEDMKAAFSTDTGQGAAIGAIIGTLIGGPIGMVVGGFLGAHMTDIVNWCSQTQAKIGAWWDETNTGFQQWRQNNKAGFDTWWSDTKTGFNDWYTDTSGKVGTWWTDTKSKFDDWWSTSSTGFGQWFTDSQTGFGDWKTDTWTKITDWAKDTMKAYDDWRGGNDKAFDTWWADSKKGFDSWKSDTWTKISTWATDTYGKFTTWSSDSGTKLSTWWQDTKTGFSQWYTTTKGSVDTWYTDTYGKISSWYTDSKAKLDTWWSETKQGFADWGKDAWASVSDYFGKIISKIGDAIQKVKDFFNAKKSASSSSSDSDYDSGGGGGSYDDFDTGERASLFGGFTQSLGARFMGDMGLGDMAGHATGGVFNKEHVARFAEGNKAEAIIPLENASAMQPFVDAVAEGVSGSISAIVSATGGSGDTVENHYHIGVLIADDKSLKKFKDKMDEIDKEQKRR